MISARRAREADLDKADIYLVSGGAIYRWFPAHSRADVAPSTERMIPYAVPAVVRPMGSGYWIRRFGGVRPQMTIELHTWNTPNGRKISVALEEMGLPYKVVPVNIGKGEQMAPGFLAISPNNKIPAIVDPDGPGGQRVSIFESGAILLYLGEKTGRFLPAPLVERIPVYEWLMWQMGGFGPMPGQVHHFIALENEADRAYGLKRYMTETRRLYGVLDRRLATREFVAGALSVADFAILGWAWRHERHKVSFADFPNVGRWYDALMARPGVKRGMEAKLD
jgi:GST-like protein